MKYYIIRKNKNIIGVGITKNESIPIKNEKFTYKEITKSQYYSYRDSKDIPTYTK